MWKKVTAQGDVPAPRSSHTATECGDKVFVFGGEQEPRVPVDDHMYCLDIGRRLWQKCITTGAGPCRRLAHCAAAIGKNIYVFGGRTGIQMGEGVLNDMFCLDTDTMTWSEVQAIGSIPEARSFAAMTSSCTYLYLFGGCSIDRHNDLYRFDTLTKTWFKLPSSNEITPRGGPGLAAVGRSIYVIAGFTGVEVNDAYRFNLDTETWQTLRLEPNIPPTSVFALTTIEKKIILFGGENTPSTEGHAGAGSFTNDVYILDTDQIDKGWNKVVSTGSPPCPRGWLQAASIVPSSQVVVFGGNTESNERMNDTYVFNLESDNI